MAILEKEPLLPSYHDAMQQVEDGHRAAREGTCQINLLVYVQRTNSPHESSYHEGPITIPRDATFLEFQMVVQDAGLKSSMASDRRHHFNWTTIYYAHRAESELIDRKRWSIDTENYLVDRENWKEIMDKIREGPEDACLEVFAKATKDFACGSAKELDYARHYGLVNGRLRLLQGRYQAEPWMVEPKRKKGSCCVYM